MSEALRVVALITAKPGSEQTVHEALSTLAAASGAEDGCQAYELFESAAAPGTFVTVESWDSQQMLDAHLTGPNVATALSTAGEHLAGEPGIHPLRPA